MLAISCNFSGQQFFYDREKQRPLRHMVYAFKDERSNDDIEVMGCAIALLTCIACSYGKDVSKISEMIFYNAKNKNIARTVKTDMLHNYVQYFDIIKNLSGALKNNEDYSDENSPRLITSVDELATFFMSDWGGWQNLSIFFSAYIAANIIKYDKIAVFSSQNSDAIKKAIGQFNKKNKEYVFSGETYSFCPINDNTLFNIKLALDTDVYDSINVVDLNLI